MRLPHSTFKSTLLILLLNSVMIAYTQTTEKATTGFIELNTSLIHYTSEWNKQAVNPGFGVVFGIDFHPTLSGELFYGNSWIKEDITGSNHNSFGQTTIHYRYFMHQAGFRLCFGPVQPKYSVRGLAGISLGSFSNLGLEGGLRFTGNIGKSFAIHAALIQSFYPLVSINDTPYGWDDPMETHWISGFRLGVGYHFR